MRIKLTSICVVAVLALVACGSDEPENSAAPNDTGTAGSGAGASPGAVQGGPLEVGVLTAKDTPGMAFWEEVGNQFAAEHAGTELTYTFANTDARPALEQRWRSGKGPDVDYGMFDGTNEATQDWAKEGDLVDLSPYLKQEDPETGETWGDSFAQSVRKFMELPGTGKVFAVPTELSAMVLFYNASIFEDNDIEPPATWDELVTATHQLKEAGVDPIAITGMFEPYMGMWTDYLFAREVGYQQTHDIFIKGEGSLAEDPGYLDALKKMQQLRDEGAFLEGFEGTDFTAAQAQFFQGKAGMILMGSWLVSEMKSVIPDDFQLGVVPFPTVDGGKGDQGALLGKPQNISINAHSDNVELAIAWAKKVTSKKVQSERAKETGEVSAVVGVDSPEGLPGIGEIVTKAGALEPAYYGLPQSKAKDIVYPEIAKMMFGKQDAEATIAAIDSGLQRVYG